jgi:zinc transport system ATP-binding protein
MRVLAEVKNLYFKYDKELILENINFKLFEREFFTITGPNGGGKSTLIKIMLGILKPTSGEVIYYNLNREDIGYVPQHTYTNSSFPITVLDIVMMGNGSKHKRNTIFNFKYSSFEVECARESLKKVEMDRFIDRKFSQLSGGQRQRVLIARALCSHPKLLILDEPTSNIDIKGQKEIYSLLKKLNENITILVVTHDLNFIRDYSSRILYINRSASFGLSPYEAELNN